MAMMAKGTLHHRPLMHSVADAKLAFSKQKASAATLVPIHNPTKDHSSLELAVSQQENRQPRHAAAMGTHLTTLSIEESSSFSNDFQLVFVYGTLKRGFWNHQAIQKQTKGNHCRLVGTARTQDRYPLVCGPFQVPFLLDKVGTGNYVGGELYQMDRHCLEAMDELEGTSKGHYMRSPLGVTKIELDPSFKASFQNALGGEWTVEPEAVVPAEGYFACSHFTDGLCEAPHIEAYTQKEHSTYVRRVNRPQNRTFKEHVNRFIEQRSCSQSRPTLVA